MNPCHIIAVHRDDAGRIVSARLAGPGCFCLSRSELLQRVRPDGSVRIALLEHGQWRDGGRVCRNGCFLCMEKECGTCDGLAALPDY